LIESEPNSGLWLFLAFNLKPEWPVSALANCPKCAIAVRSAYQAACRVPNNQMDDKLRQNLSDLPEFQSERPEPVFNVPGVIVGLLAVFVVVHLVRKFSGAGIDDWIILRFAFSAARYGGAPELQGMILPGGSGAMIWTFFSHMFLHGDWAHLLINGLWMLAFGSVVARRLGAVRFILFSLMTAAFGALAHLLVYWGQFAMMIGASGAIAGQMAGAVRLIFSVPGGLANLQNGDFSQVRVVSLRHLILVRGAFMFIGIWVLVNFVVGLSGFGAGEHISRIAWEAHLGGFLSGLLLFDLFDRRVR